MIAFTAISLGMIYVGSCNKEVAQVIIFALMNQIELELGEPLTRLLSLGLGLLFLESSQRETPTNCILLDSYERLDLAFDALRNELFGRLHHVVRKQFFENGKKGKSSRAISYQNGAALASTSNYLR